MPSICHGSCRKDSNCTLCAVSDWCCTSAVWPFRQMTQHTLEPISAANIKVALSWLTTNCFYITSVGALRSFKNTTRSTTSKPRFLLIEQNFWTEFLNWTHALSIFWVSFDRHLTCFFSVEKKWCGWFLYSFSRISGLKGHRVLFF